MKKSRQLEFEVIPAAEYSPSHGSLSVVAGPPGTGKSSFLGGMCKEGPTLLLATLAREVSSGMYQQYNPDVILFEDKNWKPEPPSETGEMQGTYVADAFLRFLDVVDMLATDQIVSESGEPYKVVLVDSGTELAEAAWREALKPFGVMDPAYIGDGGNRFGPYTALDGLMKRAITALQDLRTTENPKHVGISWHVQPTKEDTQERVGDKMTGYTVTKESKDTRAQGVEYEGSVLPMVRGQFRRKLFGLVDAFVWTDIQYERVSGSRDKRPNYVLQVVSDEERHCKVPVPVPDTKYISNGWDEFKGLLWNPTS